MRPIKTSKLWIPLIGVAISCSVQADNSIWILSDEPGKPVVVKQWSIGKSPTVLQTLSFAAPTFEHIWAARLSGDKGELLLAAPGKWYLTQKDSEAWRSLPDPELGLGIYEAGFCGSDLVGLCVAAYGKEPRVAIVQFPPWNLWFSQAPRVVSRAAESRVFSRYEVVTSKLFERLRASGFQPPVGFESAGPSPVDSFGTVYGGSRGTYDIASGRAVTMQWVAKERQSYLRWVLKGIAGTRLQLSKADVNQVRDVRIRGDYAGVLLCNKTLKIFDVLGKQVCELKGGLIVDATDLPVRYGDANNP